MQHLLELAPCKSKVPARCAIPGTDTVGGPVHFPVAPVLTECYPSSRPSTVLPCRGFQVEKYLAAVSLHLWAVLASSSSSLSCHRPNARSVHPHHSFSFNPHCRVLFVRASLHQRESNP